MRWKAYSGFTAALAAAVILSGCSSGGNSSSSSQTATKLAFTTQPNSVAIGASLGSVAVTVEDASGNAVTSSTASVTITSTASGVSGTTTVAAVNGVATFSSLSMSAAGVYTLTAASSGLTSATSSEFVISATGKLLTVAVNQAVVPNGMAGMPYTFDSSLVTSTGDNSSGTITYSYTYLNAPSWLTQSGSSLVGAPTAAAAASTVQVVVVDSNGYEGATSFDITVEAAPANATATGELSGQYACYVDRYWPGGVSGLYRGGAAFAFAASSGSVTGGEADINSPGSGPTNVAITSGSYALGSDNSGYLTLTSSSGTLYFTVAASNLSSGAFNTLSLAEMDDAGSTPSGKIGTGQCFKQTDTTASAYQTYWGSAKDFVYVFRGENGAGAVKNSVGHVSFSGGTVTGEEDSVAGGSYTDASTAATLYGYTAANADSYGRLALSVGGSNTHPALIYATDNSLGQAIFMSADAHTTSSGFFLGEVRAVNTTNITPSTTSPLSVNSVLYLTGQDSSQNYKAMIARAAGGSAAITVNAAAVNDNGAFSTTPPVTGVQTYSYTASSTRAVIGNDFFYVYDTGAAAVLFADGSGTSHQNLVGWLEPQRLTTGIAWSAGSVSNATYALNQMPNGDYATSKAEKFLDGFYTGILTLSGSSTVSASLITDGGAENWAGWDIPWYDNGGVSLTSVSIASDATYGSYGLFDVNIPAVIPIVDSYCLGVNDAYQPTYYKGKLVCLVDDATVTSPKVNIYTE